MFNDDGLGQAMALSAAQQSGEDAKAQVAMLKRDVIFLSKRVIELEVQVQYLMRRDAKPNE